MSNTHKGVSTCAAALLLALACAKNNAPEPIGSVRAMYDGTLSPELAVNTFRNIDRLFPTRTVEHGAPVHELPTAFHSFDDISFVSGDKSYRFEDYLRLDRVSGLLVIKNGTIAYERYLLGNSSSTRWMSMSIAKSITSTLIGMAVKDGFIQSIDDPVTRYVPALAGGAYDGVTIRQILTMTSGVRWNETYTDSSSDRRRLLEAQIAQQPGSALELMSSLARAAPPGSRNNYSTGETQIAGEVVRGATGKSLSAYLSEKIWKTYAMESDATWWLDSPDGHEIGGSGFSATLRDYGRFGLFFLESGVVHGDSLLPAGWTQEAGRAQVLSNGLEIDYGFMWWPLGKTSLPINKSAFSAVGIFGQAIYINPDEKVVIVQWSAQTKPLGGDVVKEDDFFAAVTMTLREVRLPPREATGLPPRVR